MRRKAQISMEFLMTYGWALLIILIAIAAISYYGITNPEKFVPESCTLPTGLVCLSHRVQTTEVLFVIRNNMGEDITVNSIAIEGCSETFTTDILNGAKANFTVDACDTGVVGKRYKSDITLTYLDAESVAHQKKGELVSRVESSTAE
jgi:uncharacterized protein (UPF0333 family)